MIAIVLTMIVTYILLKIIDLTIGVRVTGEDELSGLDISQHGEEGYNLDADLGVLGTVTGSASMSTIGEMVEAKS